MFLLLAALISTFSCADTTPDWQQKIIGSWEAVTEIKNGVENPYHESDPNAPSGYQNSFRRLQYQITADKIRMVISDEIAVQDNISSDYQMNGDAIVPINTAQTTMDPMRVVSVTDDKLTLTPLNDAQQNQGQLLFARIPESKLMFNRLQPIEVGLSMEITYGDQTVNKKFSGVYDKVADRNETPPVRNNFSCLWYSGRPMNFLIQMVETKNVDGVEQSTAYGPRVSFLSRAEFDWVLEQEEIDTVVPGPKVSERLPSGLDGNFSQIQFALVEGGQCLLHLARHNRWLHYSGSCEPLELASGDGHEIARDGFLNFDGNCVIDFQK